MSFSFQGATTGDDWVHISSTGELSFAPVPSMRVRGCWFSTVNIGDRNVAVILDAHELTHVTHKKLVDDGVRGTEYVVIADIDKHQSFSVFPADAALLAAAALSVAALSAARTHREEFHWECGGRHIVATIKFDDASGTWFGQSNWAA